MAGQDLEGTGGNSNNKLVCIKFKNSICTLQPLHHLNLKTSDEKPEAQRG